MLTEVKKGWTVRWEDWPIVEDFNNKVWEKSSVRLWGISTALWWWDTVTQVKATSLPTYTPPPPTCCLCVCLGGWMSACVGKGGKLTERACYPQVMGENVLLMETGDILLKFTANLNLMGHNLSSWRKETPFTWELLFGSYKWVTGKRARWTVFEFVISQLVEP